MAFRLKFSRRALRETGEAQEWYELQTPELGEEFIAAVELQLKRLEQAPLLYAEVIPGVRRALLPRFPYGLFYAVRGDLVHILAVLHDARNPNRWPQSRRG
ncbi:MAG: type II toxin-antitoxin system RelE/ParE family toxin [Ferrovum sp.]|jgi:plasmid stabilization system protein ParE|uniref:type II toxin-antitoxin system RelE/ParE family toxin n=1 Tax=Ferrovum sp. TaxID=2609467 RepID=UPI002616D066|nr:type II toxin-antitoxin system RelE/ParE family toxin [Ferrovum sp.]MBW8067791.1 type II toxin-antitoxin system RelE/ParE family toxin [Ferrovum sp.]